ncbi:unnamed protein product (macronuclear) [Paramecium tetraurelia]|uniref:RING-type domain-containing protein n=1 Tax=Paramecium tetraurelia TaxID=5888 RepID=A0C0S5_PARTE|nr:uncharacterized protein GSPATT00033868001 [Paramecium tetraurelia]CAK64392.1 unnamed protein product [Paramecium tetraurelia]|eukprot:XP_001431790.1 hypothetical protein (macronuclear) [Paramecium tetraurelia strain d4-2]
MFDGNYHFIFRKMKGVYIYLIITLLDCLFITSFLVLEQQEYHLYIYSNAFLFIAIIVDSYSQYSNRDILESLKTLKRTLAIVRLYILICSIFVSLKLDKLINWDWSAVLWNLWLGLFCSIGIGVACSIVTFNKIVQYLFDKSSYKKSKIIFYIWLTQLIIYVSICIGLISFGYLDFLSKTVNYTKKFLILQYFLLAELVIIMFYSIYFHKEIKEYIFSTLQDDEPLTNQQQQSANTQGNNQTLQILNTLSSRTRVPQVMQKISKAYFSIPKRQHSIAQDSIYGSPVLKKLSKGHKRAFSSQGVGSQMLQEIDFKIFEKQSCTINQEFANIVKSQVDKKKSNSQLISADRDESIQNYKPDLSQNSNICIVCYERGPNAVFMNCGHGGVCYQCAIDIWKQKTECYLCRDKIIYIVKVDLDERVGDLFKVVSTTQMIDQFKK